MRLDTPDGAHRALDDGWFVIKPGDPAKSVLVERIFHDDPDEMMPPPESHLALSADERRLLVRWIEQGADYEPHWAFVPVPRPRRCCQAPSPATAIDALVRARLAREQLSPQPEAEPAVLLRRLAFNVTGLPPTPAELEAFLADTRPGAYERAVDRYLASPAYGERMAMDWLDLARYADTYGYQADVDRDMSPWRDWVIRAFAQNLSYDRFLTWQLAGDLLPERHRRSAPGDRLQPPAPADQRRRQRRRGVPPGIRLGSRPHLRHGDAGPDPRVRPLPRSQVRSDHAARLLRPRRLLQQHRRVRALLALHQRDADAGDAACGRAGRVASSTRRCEARIARLEARLATIAREAPTGFAAWRRTARLTVPTPVVHLDFAAAPMPAAAGDKDRTPRLADRVAATPARLHDDPEPVTDAGAARRRQRRLPVQRRQRRHPSRGADLPPHRCVLDRHPPAPDGARRIAPSSCTSRARGRTPAAAATRSCSTTAVRPSPWSTSGRATPSPSAPPRRCRSTRGRPLVATYDGSSRAAGLRLYVDGSPIATETVRDRLTRDIDYRKAWGDNSAQPPLTIGARFRDSGFKNGLLDDVRLFDVALTAAEVRGTLRDAPDDVRPGALRRPRGAGAAPGPRRAAAAAAPGRRAGLRRARDHGDGRAPVTAPGPPPRARRLRRAEGGRRAATRRTACCRFPTVRRAIASAWPAG